MLRKKRIMFEKVLSVVLSFVMLLPMLAAFRLLPFTAYSVGGDETVTEEFPFSDVFDMRSDPDTANAEFDPSTLENGRLWTDKTVSEDKFILYDTAGKPIDGIDAQPDEFLITLSALSQSFSVDTFVEPTDTVFVLDVSASMYINKLDNGKSRIEMLVEALNDAIVTMMDGNPNNRFAVVAYGGDSGNSRIYPILKLGHHVVSDGKYFSMRSAAYVQVSSQIPDSSLIDPSNRAVRVNGGTPTQRGIYAGAKILLDNNDTTYTVNRNGNQVTVTRKPNIVLMTDGGPTLGWTDYRFEAPDSDTDNGFDCGDANHTDMAIDLLTVLTAAHMKQTVRNHYYKEDNAKSVGFFTIGLDVDSVHAHASMNPYGFPDPPVAGVSFNAELIRQSYSGNIYNMKSLLDSFVAGEEVTFPALNKGATSVRSLRSVQNTGNFIKTYDYTDRYYSAISAKGLEDAFAEIAHKLVSKGSYSTKVDPGSPPDFDGYLVFSDVIGEYMEVRDVKGLWYENNRYDGHIFAKEISRPDMQAEFIHVLEEYGIPQNAAPLLLSSNLAAGKANGGLYFGDDLDFSNKITYYTDSERNYAGSYFTAEGTPAAVPSGAMCAVEMYTVRGSTVNSVTGEPTDLMDISFQVVTALETGSYQCVFSDGNALTRSLKKGDQVVRWHIPASLIPLRTVRPVFDEDGITVTAMQIAEAVPIRIVYSVGLRPDLVLAKLDEDYSDENKASGAYYFYTNQYQHPKNLSIAFFQPSESNPYYYYTEAETDQDGRIPLYDETGNPAESYTVGGMYTKNVVFDLETPGYLREIFLPVNETVADISGKNGVPYIEPGQNKWQKNAYGMKSEDIAGTELPYAFLDEHFKSNGELIRVRYLMNNGRITVPFTDLKVIKEWSSGLDTLIKPEYIQLYANGEAFGDPVLLTPEDAGSGVNPTAEYTWEYIPVYNPKPDDPAAAVFIRYTVAEGTVTSGTFIPYGENEDFIVNYYQPQWDNSHNVWSDAQIVNTMRAVPYAPQRLFVIDKSFEGLQPSDIFTGPLSVAFEIYIDEGSGFADDPAITIYYPRDFINGRYIFDSTVQSENYKITEKHIADIDGWIWSLSAAADTDPANYDLAADDGGYTLVIENIENNSVVNINLLNSYTHANPTRLTLEKKYAGSIGSDDTHDITFVVEGWTDDTKTTQIFSDSTHCHYIKHEGGVIAFPIPVGENGIGIDGAEHPQILPPGYYTVTEYGAAGAINSGDPYSRVHDVILTADGDAAGLSKTADNEVGFLLNDGDDVTVTLTNTYKQRAALILEKTIICDEDTVAPEEIVFTVEGSGGYQESIAYGMFKDGKYVLKGLVPGTYTVIEEPGTGVVPGYDAHAVSVDGIAGNSKTVTLVYDGNDETVAFANTYVKQQNPPPANLMLEKILIGDVPDPIPADIVFRITNSGEYDKSVPYSDFINGKYEITGLEPGDYTVLESGGESDGYSLSVNHEDGFTVSLDHGSDTTVVFTNTYTKKPDDPDTKPSLTVRKVFRGLETSEIPKDILIIITGPDGFYETLGYDDLVNDRGKFENLSASGDYIITESGCEVPGFDMTVNPVLPLTVSINLINETDENSVVTIENTYVKTQEPPGNGSESPKDDPNDPNDPSDPEPPDSEPEQPEHSENDPEPPDEDPLPSSKSDDSEPPDDTTKEPKNTNPDTGNRQNPIVWLIISGLSLFIICVVTAIGMFKKRR
ncbi:MAG: hypothetical protein FWG69_03015 [Oscillospiraceae bacterium]|nr:hypothetical protein [Oscillospiraceae bacterium]